MEYPGRHRESGGGKILGHGIRSRGRTYRGGASFDCKKTWLQSSRADLDWPHVGSPQGNAVTSVQFVPMPGGRPGGCGMRDKVWRPFTCGRRRCWLGWSMRRVGFAPVVVGEMVADN